jgi:hypothetical protein
MAAMAAMLDLVSIDFLTNALVDWSDLLGVTGGRFLSMTSAAAHPTWPQWQPSWIWFPCQLVRFFCGSLGVTGGRFLSIISSAAHPR